MYDAAMPGRKREASSLAVDRIESKLEKLRAKDKRLSVFGASAHRYVLHPPLAEKTVAAFERKWHITLPDDYRRFLVEVGNGGAGPAYGVFKLGEEDAGFGHRKWKHLIDDPSKPFRHARAWNLPAAVRKKQPDPKGMTPEEEDEAWSAWGALVHEQYRGLMDGAIPICHLGCALRQWLVVTGPRAGEVWNDDRADERGIAPLTKNRHRVTFAEWYEGWLDASLRRRL